MRPLADLQRDALLYASRLANAGWAPPDWLTVNLTLRCNLACVMCTTCYDSPELTLPEILGLIDQASAWGVRVFNPLGGEAFVRKDLEDILAHAVRRRMFVTLTTNGTLVTAARAARIAALPPEQLHVNVSVDGLRETHDGVRGEGNFDRMLAGYRHFRAEDLRAGQPRRKIVANVILHRLNVAEFPALLDRLAQEGFSGVQVLNLFRNPADPDVGGMWFQPGDLSALTSLVQALADAAPLPILTPRADLLRIPRYYSEGLTPLEAKCWAGWKELYVNADGTAIMCDGKLDFLAGGFGSVREHTLRELWQSPAVAARRAVVKSCTTPCLQNCYLRREADSARGIGAGLVEHARRAVRERLPPKPVVVTDTLVFELSDVPADAADTRFCQLAAGVPAGPATALEQAADPVAWGGLRDRGQLDFGRGFMGAEVLEGLLGDLRAEGMGARRVVLGGRGDPLLHPELDRVLAACERARAAGLVAAIAVVSALPRTLPAGVDRVPPPGAPWISWDGWLADGGDPALQRPVADALKVGVRAAWAALAG